MGGGLGLSHRGGEHRARGRRARGTGPSSFHLSAVRSLLLLWLIAALVVPGAVVEARRDASPADAHASPEARALLAYLGSISGNQTLAGQHNFPGTLSQYSERAKEIAGRYPAVWGQDFGFAAEGKDAIRHRPAIIAEAKRQAAAGSIVTLMWHAVRPTDREPNGWRESVQNHLTDAQWSELVTPGSPLNQRWLAQVDVIAGYLGQLRDAHVPVLWRPLHELNGGWFWWGGRPGEHGTAALWRLLFDRMVNHHHLDNLLWVWSPNIPGGSAQPFEGFYPGASYVDALALDVYRRDFPREPYEALVRLADGKPVGLGEVGKMPSPADLAAQPRWTWFLTWTDFLNFANKPEDVRALYADPRVLTRDRVRLTP